MSLWIKICANMTVGDAQLAAEVGADAVGFVFARSPRQVTVEQAAAIVPHLPRELEKIGVFVDAPLDAIAAAVEGAQLTGVQLHSGLREGFAGQLRVRFGPTLRILQVVHFGGNAAVELAAASASAEIDGVLVDSRTGTAAGGTGVAFDWERASATIFAPGRKVRLIAAGGLTPANVAQAIGLLRPWGVDVASGVEAVPGRKDPDKLRAFVAAARQAARDADGLGK